VAQSRLKQSRKVTLGAVMVVFLLGALDQTIVATAMPRIVAELRGLELYSWVTTAYLLSSTVMVPIWGKLGDLYGRKPILLAGIAIFTLGSWLCGVAGEFGALPLIGSGMMQLILFRAVQGIGSGALFTSAFAVIADLFPPRERGRYSGLFGGVFGLASILGPVIGGFLTEHGDVDLAGLHIEGWRWVFYVNLPLALLAMALIAFKMPDVGKRPAGQIDWLGAALIVAAFVPLLLAMTWGGATTPWSSPTILALFGVSAAALLLLWRQEARAPEPIIPLGLFRIRTFWTANLAAFVISMSFLGTVTYLPLYLQLGRGIPATQSGATLIPLMGGLVLASTIAGHLVTRTGCYRRYMIAGGVLLFAGVFLLARMGPDVTLSGIAWRLFIVGLGLGPAQSLFGLAVQNAVAVTQLGVATSATQFFRQIGATIGVALFGAILTDRLAAHMRALHPDAATLGLAELQSLALGHGNEGVALGAGRAASVIDPGVAAAFSAAMQDLFTVSLVVIAMGIVVTTLIPQVPLRRHTAPEPTAEPGLGEDLKRAEPAE
jgi:EmrB/QacA subfamily drug resistance transporter